jgi:dihydrodipicolinate synthase/N-acetylneuraminate lyase
VEIFETFERGDLAGAQAAQRRLTPIRLALTLGTAPGGVKAALDVLGMSIGPSRAPVSALPADKLQKMRAALQSAGMLPA